MTPPLLTDTPPQAPRLVPGCAVCAAIVTLSALRQWIETIGPGPCVCGARSGDHSCAHPHRYVPTGCVGWQEST